MPRTVMTENTVKWFSNNGEKPFLEYNIESNELNIIDQNAYQKEMDYTLYNDISPTMIFFNSWFPKNASTILRLIIGDIIHGKFYENKKDREEIINLIKNYNLK